MKILFLDTCAVVKILVPEKGHDVMMWLLSSEVVLLYSVLLITSTHVRDEFARTIANMVSDGRLPASHEKGILMLMDILTTIFRDSIALTLQNRPSLASEALLQPTN